MTTIEMLCRTCGQPFNASRDDLLSLPPAIYRQCPACRDGEDARPHGCIDPDCAVIVGHQIHRCSGCEWPIGQQPMSAKGGNS